MRRFSILQLACFCLISVTGCSETVEGQANDDLTGSWQLDTINGEATEFFPPVHLVISDTTLSAFSGCAEWRWNLVVTSESEAVLGTSIPVVSCEQGLNNDTKKLLLIMDEGPEIHLSNDTVSIAAPQKIAVFSPAMKQSKR